MPRKFSAGLIVYRWTEESALELLLVHPGGPFWARKDDGAWSIPKGEYAAHEDPWLAAKREFTEETGCIVPPGAVIDVGAVTYANKTVMAWAVQGDIDAERIHSNTFTMIWPPRSGTIQEFSEVDRAAWFGLDDASRKLVAGQRPFVDRLREQLHASR